MGKAILVVLICHKAPFYLSSGLELCLFRYHNLVHERNLIDVKFMRAEPASAFNVYLITD